ncbi:hypothetical protein [Rhodocyclus tenuis]|uniref:Uncharacterized protein n=1 Tax=Rhodocyclus tenuis TaxID=1066 RepID=A0A840GCB1_RHOTE|nr:hypothetical protein [Rhodocyclus tenuis]MBB4248500.1 hypothetical protein [Rhodocyclus tenuis]
MKVVPFKYLRGNYFRKLMSVFGFFLLGIILSFSSTRAYSGGKKYSKQGANFADAMQSVLESRGLCGLPKDCYSILPRTIETDSSVYIQFYEVGEKNRAAFLAVVDLSLSEGVQITGGVPIIIEAFRETQEEYRTSGLIVK